MPMHTAIVAGFFVTKASARAINAGLASELGAEPIAHAPQGTGNAKCATSNIIWMLLGRNE